MSDIYDIVIIGTGPAGISAAITSTMRNKKILLIGSRKLSVKIRKAAEIRNYPGFPIITGEELSAALKKHIDSMGIEILDERVKLVYNMGKFFSIQAGNNFISSKTVIIATGVNFGKPLEGEEEFLGKGVSYCATCDAPLYRGKSAAVIGYSKEAEKEADFLSEICTDVLYFPLYKGDINVSENVTVVNEIPVKIAGDKYAESLVTSENKYEADVFFVLREAIAPKHMVPGIAFEGNHISVDINMKTNIPGVFACGDIAGRPYQYIKAAGQGNIAALSAVEYMG